MSILEKRGAVLATALGVALGVAVLAVTTAGGGGSSEAASDDGCVPQEAWTETTDWVTESPGEGWYQVEERTVTDQEATTEQSDWVTESPGEGWVQIDQRTVDGDLLTEAHWQRYCWNGPWESDEDPPPFPDERWQPNVEGDPHQIGEEGAYYRSSGGSGQGDWFYLEWVEATYTQVTEYLYEREVPAETHQEFRFAFDHPAVECPNGEEPNGEEPNGEDPNGEDANGEDANGESSTGNADEATGPPPAGDTAEGAQATELDQGTQAADEPAAQAPDEAGTGTQDAPDGAADRPAKTGKTGEAPIDRLPDTGPLSTTTAAGWLGLLLLLGGILTVAMTRPRPS